MNTRIFTLLFAFLAMMPSVGWGQDSAPWNGSANTDWYNENQTEFTITTAEQLAGLAKLVNEGNSFDEKTIYLDADIVLNENVLNAEKELNEAGEYKQWTPIGSSESYYFGGTFDGQGHSIVGLYIITSNAEDDDIENLALFEYAGDNDASPVKAIIRNVNIVDSYIKGGCKDNVSGLCAYGTNVDISNCSFDGLIIAENPLDVAAICVTPYVTNQIIIESCNNQSNINVVITKMFDAIGTPETNISGIGGTNTVHTVYNCYNTGNITVTINNVDNQYGMISIGGIGSSGNIASCYNEGDITVSGADNNCIIGIGGISGMSSDTSAEIKYCYNIGEINSTVTSTSTAGATIAVGAGSIIGMGTTSNSSNLTKNYYLKTGNGTEKGIGAYLLGGKFKDEIGKIEGIEDFSTGEIAWKMREPIIIELLSIMGKPNGETIEVTGYGQELTEDGVAIDETPVLLAFDENKGKEVYQLILNSDGVEGITNDTKIYRNAEESNLLSEETYNQIMENAKEGLDLVWYSGEKVVTSGNVYRVTADETLTAKLEGVYNITTAINPEEAGTIDVKERAANGEEVTFSLEITDGYELVSVTVNEDAVIDENADGVYSFTMPAKDVTLTANFQKAELPTDPDEGDEGDDIHHPQRPIKYYNIYVDTICPGLDVETSKDVVQEGHQVSAYLTIQAECDTTGMRFEYKRGLFGYWQDLKDLEGVQPGEYIIKNIYTDIYIRALDATLPEEEPTGLDDLEGIQAYAKEGSIYVYTPNREEVTIVSMSGAILKHEEQVGWQSYDVNRGIYIVRIGEKVFKLKN